MLGSGRRRRGEREHQRSAGFGLCCAVAEELGEVFVRLCLAEGVCRWDALEMLSIMGRVSLRCWMDVREKPRSTEFGGRIWS